MPLRTFLRRELSVGLDEPPEAGRLPLERPVGLRLHDPNVRLGLVRLLLVGERAAWAGHVCSLDDADGGETR